MLDVRKSLAALTTAVLLAACGQQAGLPSGSDAAQASLNAGAQRLLPPPCEQTSGSLECGDPTPPAPPTDAGEDAVIPGQYIVVLKEAVPASSVTALSIAPQDPVDALAQQLIAKVGGQLLQSFSGVRMFSATLSDAAVVALQSEPSVAYVQANRVVNLEPPAVDVDDQTAPTNTVKATAVQFLPPSWGLDRIDQRLRPYDNQYNYTTTAPNVNVYVVDTGIRATHQDFGGRVSLDFTAINDGYGASDCLGHGTHVAGTIGGSTYGVAKGVQLHSVRVLSCFGNGSDASVIAGFNFVTLHRQLPAVANASLGGSNARGQHQVIADAAVRTTQSGVTVVVAAGNGKPNFLGNNVGANACDYVPANAGHQTAVITVGATNSNDRRASFSNYGECVSLFAPGVDINSDWNGSDTDSRGDSGTSMASPHVAGAAALYLQDHPGDSAAQVKSALLAQASSGLISKVGQSSPNLLLYWPGVTTTVPSCGALASGQSLPVSTSLFSCNHRFELRVQGDGNLVLYRNGTEPLWSNGNSWGKAVERLTMQGDGNLVLYGPGGVPLWNTPNTWGHLNPYLVLQDDGNLIMFDHGTPIWATNTH